VREIADGQTTIYIGDHLEEVITSTPGAAPNPTVTPTAPTPTVTELPSSCVPVSTEYRTLHRCGVSRAVRSGPPCHTLLEDCASDDGRQPDQIRPLSVLDLDSSPRAHPCCQQPRAQPIADRNASAVSASEALP
jgi:hypothetical protein